jgi:hypothetical protein
MKSIWNAIRACLGLSKGTLALTYADLEEEAERQTSEMFENGVKVKLFSVAKSGPWWLVGVKVGRKWEIVDRFALIDSALEACDRLPVSFVRGVIAQREEN